jgi:site-specific DNA-methyltransferase (adenine-specific)
MSYVIGDAPEELRRLPDETFHCCVTSPAYWNLRDYGVKGQLGLEATPAEYVERVVDIFREVRRVLRNDGTCWLNLGDSYIRKGGARGSKAGKNSWVTNPAMVSGAARGRWLPLPPGLKHKDLVGIPWRVALALQEDGWWLRRDIIWHKPQAMPEAVTDRPACDHEYLFLLTESERYHYDAEAVRERASRLTKPRGKGINPKARANVAGARQNPSFSGAVTGSVEWRNKRTVWRVPTRGYAGPHHACFSPEAITPCILAGCPPGGIVLDPFLGSGTTGEVAEQLGRQWFGIELNPEYEPLIRERTAQTVLFG